MGRGGEEEQEREEASREGMERGNFSLIDPDGGEDPMMNLVWCFRRSGFLSRFESI